MVATVVIVDGIVDGIMDGVMDGVDMPMPIGRAQGQANGRVRGLPSIPKTLTQADVNSRVAVVNDLMAAELA